MCWTLFETIGRSSNIWSPLGKPFASPGAPSWLRAWVQGLWHQLQTDEGRSF